MQRRILIVGSTLALQSIAAALVEIPQMDLRHTTSAPDLWPGDFVPDAVLFDVYAGTPDCAHACLAADKPFLLLGFDLESHQVLRLAGTPASLSTLADLTELLTGAVASEVAGA